MLKKIIIVLTFIIVLSGCDNKVEKEKNAYLNTKSTLETKEEFATADTLPCDITISLDRINEEKITYKAVLDNPKQDMHNVKVLVVHNQYTEEIYPSIGLLDDSAKSLMTNEYNNELALNGNLDTTSDITALALEFRVWLEYEDSNQELHTTYYKTTI